MLKNQEQAFPTERPILRLRIPLAPWVLEREVGERVECTRHSLEWVFWGVSRESREKWPVNPRIFIPYTDIANRWKFSIKKELVKKVWVRIPQDMLVPQIFLSFYKLSNQDIITIADFVGAEDINRVNKWQKSEGKLKCKLVKSWDDFFLQFWNHRNSTQIKVEIQVQSGAKK